MPEKSTPESVASKKVLQILDDAYRCTIEEQDDPIIWLSHVLSSNGANISLLLRGTSVNYAVVSQDPSGLCFGDRPQTNPANLVRDIANFARKNVPVFVIQEDLNRRGISRDELVDSVEVIPQSGVAALFDQHDQIWNW